MKNTRFKLWGLVVAFAFALAPLLVVPVLADATDAPELEVIYGIDSISKILVTNAPETPNANFIFDFYLLATLEGNQADAPFGPRSEISTHDIAMNFPSYAAPISDEMRTNLGLAEDVRAVYQRIYFLRDHTFTAPGHFVYRLTERANTNTLPFNEGFIDTMNYSRYVYEVHIIVTENADGGFDYAMHVWLRSTNAEEFNRAAHVLAVNSPDADLTNNYGKVPYVTFTNEFIRRTQGLPDDEIPTGTTAPTEVTTAPTEVTTAPTEVTTAPTEVTTAPTEVTTAPTEVTTAPTEVTTAPTEVTTAPTGPTPPPPPAPDNAPTISKTIEGRTASATTLFNFDVYITPHSMDDEASFDARLQTFQNGVWTTVNTVNFGAGAATFQLRHNQRLMFYPTLLGTTFNVTERTPSAYTASVELILGNTRTTVRGAQGQDVSTGDFQIVQGTNYAGFLNTNHRDVPITGIILNNLPTLLVTISIAGFIALVLVNNKRRKAYE